MNIPIHTALFRFLICFYLLLTGFCCEATDSPFASTKDLPVSFQGRFRSLDSTARLWLYDYYHSQQLKRSDLTAFNTDDASALNLLWEYHFLGHKQFDSAPFFWIHLAELKSLLQLTPDLTRDRFSYKDLYDSINTNRITNINAIKILLTYEFARTYLNIAHRSKSDKVELTTLSKDLWLTLRGNDIILINAPKTSPWLHLEPGMVIASNAKNRLNIIEREYKTIASDLIKLFQLINNYVDSQDYKSPLKMLPSRHQPGEWLSLYALNSTESTGNFTTFSDREFNAIRNTYLTLSSEAKRYYLSKSKETYESLQQASIQFTDAYNSAYNTIAGTPYKKATGKSLSYPTHLQLQLESLYYRLPLIELACIAYLVAIILFIASTKLNNNFLCTLGLTFAVSGFLIHTAVLAIRCYILNRPPVSNMFETIIYVPWIAIIIGLIFYITSRATLILSAATLTSLALLLLLKITNLDSRLENVQAVLDSQYWLIVHVLMVVGSYGAFIVSGILGHFYLFSYWNNPYSNEKKMKIAKGILYTMYVGVALLIPGTILGGVWAAESWGRFWDWDPKESWAFISACVYLLVVHAYTFNRIADLGLAIGSIGGLMAISFTWYGVNYILGSGLHTYGFGNGGEIYYFAYLVIEIVIIIFLSAFPRKKTS